jgi:dTDP-4-amino-4,6-dideoxygalactose transaminase
MVANHGQRKKYVHQIVGCNSRLDTLQAAILLVKLQHLNEYCDARRKVADFYDQAFAGHPKITIPLRATYSHHVYHQYTIILEGTDRDRVKTKLEEKGIPSMIYYPIPAHRQKMFEHYGIESTSLATTDWLAAHVISLPIHTEMTEEQMNYIASQFIEILNTI